jgi:HNH endonuclease/AP2 domain
MFYHTPIPPPKDIIRRIDNDVEYYPSTGLIIWINPQSSKLKPGDIAGNIKADGYISIGFKSKSGGVYKILAHHIAYYKMRGKWPPREMDHKRGNRADNRWSKLRLAKHHQNISNQKLRINNTSGITGISWYKATNKWQVRIGHRYRTINVGYFSTLQEAIKARRQAEKKYFGKFRRRHN